MPHDAPPSLRYSIGSQEGSLPVLSARDMGNEVLRACIVLAMILLGFAHPPVVAGPGPAAVAAALEMSYCGDLPDAPKAHAPCHACRTDGAAPLPPSCAIGIPVALLADVAYGAMPVLRLPPGAPRPFDARGPPFA